MVVVEDSDGSSTRAPGIYYADTQGKWKELIPGKVLTGSAYQGILAQLSLSKVDRRYASFAVVDQKLRLFQMNSQKIGPESIITFGEGGIDVLDIHGTKVTVPRISRIEDLVIRSLAHTAEGQTVFISIRAPENSLVGDGLTLAFFVKKGSAEELGKIELASPPIVIDYRFLTFEQLGNLSPTSGKITVFSKLLGSFLLNKTSKDPMRDLEEWREKLKKGMDQVDSYCLSTSTFQELPVIDLGTGSISIQWPPSVNLNIAGLTLTQKYDIINGLDEIQIPGKLTVEGRINRKCSMDPKNRFHVYSNTDSKNSALVYFNSELHFVLNRNAWEAPVILPLERKTNIFPDQASYSFREIPLNSKLREYYVFFSIQTRSESKTVAYILKEVSPGALTLDRKIEIAPEWIEQNELSQRVKVFEAGQGSTQILFDYHTPVQNSVQAYQQMYVDTIQLLNVSKSTNDKRSYSFIKALEERELSNRLGVYKRFDPIGNSENPSALFIFGRKEGEVFDEIKGELLETAGTVGTPEIFTKEIKIYDGKVPARVSIVALDGSSQHGLRSFKLMVILSYIENEQSGFYFDPIVMEVNIPQPFSTLAGFQLVQGGKSGTDQFVLLISFTPSKDPSTDRIITPNTGLSAITWKIETTKDRLTSKFGLNTPSFRQSWTTPDMIGLSSMSYRIKLDTEGNIYWVATPDKDPQDSKYNLVNLVTGSLVSPNVYGGRAIKFLTEEDTEKRLTHGKEANEGSSLFRAFQNKLSLMNRYDVAKMSGYEIGEFENLKDSLQYFPGLEEELDRLADPTASPTHEMFVVSDEMYSHFWNSMIHLMTREKGQKSRFHIDNRSVSISALDSSNPSQFDLLRALEVMRDPVFSERKSILIGQSNNLIKVLNPESDSERRGFTLKDPELQEDGASIVPPLVYLLSTEGREVNLIDYRNGKLPDKKISMALVVTPAHLNQLKKTHEVLNRFPILESFHINKRFLTGSWKVWKPGVELASKKIQEFSQQPISDLEKDIFPNLNQALLDLSDQNTPAKHKVLLVSRELKPLVNKMIFSRWAASEGHGDFWNHQNASIELYQYSESKQSQESIFNNFEAMRGNSERSRAVFLAELQDLVKTGRPAQATSNKGAPFLIADINSTSKDSKTDSALPHILYLLETEGEKIPLEEFSAHIQKDRAVSMLLIGEPSDWEALKKDLSLEARYNLAHRFELFELQTPSIRTRRELLQQVMKQPEIRRLNYQFDARELALKNHTFSPAEAEEKLLGYLVNRSETLSQQFSQEVTSSFIKVLTAFRAAVVEDPELRVNKIIDRSYVERLLSKIYSIPLNLNILPPNDPYVQLSQERAALRLQEEGYRGPLELKSQVIRTLLAPTRNDPARAIPGSIVIFGDSSTGKTMLFKTTMKMLGLKEYNYNNPSDEEAGYMVVNVGRLTSSKEPPGPEVMSVDETLDHISNFLSLPKGFRGHILFDDMHKGDREVIKSLLKFLQSLFDAEKGMILVKRLHSSGNTPKYFEIPVRNIHPWVTLNPTQDQKKIERFSKAKTPTDVDVVVATLSSDDNPIERSFLMRWGLVLNLSRFPLDAKAPALSDSLRSSSRNDFNVQGRLVLVSPLAINQVVSQFPDSNAREFLSAATSQLLQTPNESGEKGSLHVVVPASSVSVRNDSIPRGSWEASGRENGNIENYIRKSMVAVPIESRVDGKLHLLSLMVDAFRTHVYESFVDSMTQDERFAGGQRQLKNVLAPALHGAIAHLREKEYVPLSALNLDPRDFIETKLQLKEFQNLIENYRKEQKAFTENWFNDCFENFGNMSPLFNSQTSYYEDRSRAQVVREVVSKVNTVLNSYLEILLRVNSIRELPASSEWLSSLKENEPSSKLYKLGSNLADLYLEFWSMMYDPRLVENRNPEKYSNLNSYDVSRMFGLIIDRSITQMAWGSVNRFMLENLLQTTSDMEIGQRSAVQFYLFTSKTSLLKAATHELVYQIATSSQAYKEWSDEFKNRLQKEFEGNAPKAFDSSHKRGAQ